MKGVRVAAGALAAFVGLLGSTGRALADPDSKIQFNRDIRPILSANCYMCHGPDSHRRKADLRLDKKEGLFSPLKDGSPVVPGKPEQSEISRRIFSQDPDEMMPPPKSDKKLSAREMGLIKRWIEEGAAWQPHWAFIAPQRLAPPQFTDPADARWIRNPIDSFVLDRLHREGLHPSPEADKVTLIRRATLDLTGLPPTPTEVDAFVVDASPDAYEKVVDRLLASPRYGERLATEWLDAARYADTHGYHIDSGRDQTHWRDWVINAFTNNKPFDQFIVEQLAGDLLPNSSDDQKIATGFVRNNMVNFEGGAIPEEYQTAYVIDRVNTTGTVFMGLTVGCTQCHDHKFDPITQKEFYQLYAFFNNVPEKGLDGARGNAGPLLRAPTREQMLDLSKIAATEAELHQKLTEPPAALAALQSQWEKLAGGNQKPTWTVLNPSEMKSTGGAYFAQEKDGCVAVTGPAGATDTYLITAPVSTANITAVRLEALPDNSLAGSGPGRSINGNFVLTAFHGSVEPASGQAGELQFRAATADFSQDKFPVRSTIDGAAGAGWAIFPKVGKPHEAIFELAQPLRHADRLQLRLEFQSSSLQHQLGRFRLSVTNSPSPARGRTLPADVASALSVPPSNRTATQAATVRDYYRQTIWPEGHGYATELAHLKKHREELEAAAPSTMVMEEMAKPRPSYILLRGQYDKHGDVVTPNLPAFLPPMPADQPKNRLGLARWLVDPSHPLTARVTINRYWQMFFGTGLVKTAEDFGAQGELPSHPELLDWLAVEFRDGPAGTGSGPASPRAWDLRHMVRLMLTSSTYRQGSVVTPELNSRDPENRLLARGPRFRLQAEFIRDQALAASGLLDGRIGGASVSPYQPAGLWEELMSRNDGNNWTAQTYTQSHGPDLYRRTMYTFWKRTSPPPSLSTFDAPDREGCTVRRGRTNTPLQALVLMNDPTYVEASRKLAERMMHEAGMSGDDRIALGFRLVLARKPSAEEVSVLKDVFERELARYQQDAPAADKLLAVGEAKRDPTLSVSELAAWTNVVSVILNLDEAVTKS